MRYVQMLGLAVLTAAALMALVGVGTASATTLCENNQTTGCTKHVNSDTEIDFSAEDSVVTKGPLGIIILTCTESTIKGATTTTGDDSGKAVSLQVTSFAFGHCGTRDVISNTVTTGTLTIDHIAGTDNGTVKNYDTTWSTKTIPSGLGIPETCNYLTTATHIGTLTGSLTAPTIDISATIPAETAGCPNGTWSGHYIYTGSTPFIVSD